ncbi:hypothetical protein PHLGIDRAFT_348674, partial [Phlebiopsis gigantea 11061_1 CR5-6]
MNIEYFSRCPCSSLLPAASRLTTSQLGHSNKTQTHTTFSYASKLARACPTSSASSSSESTTTSTSPPCAFARTASRTHLSPLSSAGAVSSVARRTYTVRSPHAAAARTSYACAATITAAPGATPSAASAARYTRGSLARISAGAHTQAGK